MTYLARLAQDKTGHAHLPIPAHLNVRIMLHIFIMELTIVVCTMLGKNVTEMCDLYTKIFTTGVISLAKSIM